MDASDNPVHKSVMLALLPTTDDWCHIDLPHLTLVYGGSKEDLPLTAFNALAKDAAMLAMLGRPLSLKVRSRETFGDWEKADVFRLQPNSELWAMRRAVEDWNKSEYDFNPHVTIGPVGSPVEIVPRYIRFDRVFVGWGDENLTFWLGR